MTVCVNGINSYNVNATPSVNKVQNNPAAPQTAPIQNAQQTAFRGSNDKTGATFRTTLASKEEQKYFNTVSQNLSGEDKKLLNALLKSGILLKNNSDNNSSVLDNLYQIATTPRAEGLDKNVILKNVITTLAFPYAINQKLGDIPTEYKAKVLGSLLENKDLGLSTLQEADAKFNNLYSSTCPTACVEFNLASKHQAEFARFVNDLSSPKLSTDKIIDFRNLSKNLGESVRLLHMFNTNFEVIDANRAKVTLKPDKDAILRAQIQCKHQDGMERNAMDVLVQSTLMNLGSQGTYNSLIDERGGEIAVENSGLIEFEKTFVESVVENKSTTSMLYQQVDNNMVITGYECDFSVMRQQLLDTLKRDQNVIIGITQLERDKEHPDPSRSLDAIAGGHEITVVGAKVSKSGETIFICQDSDDEVNMPIEYPESWLLPRLHHAGLPEDIAERTMPADMKENWEITMDCYKDMKGATGTATPKQH